MQTTNHSLAEVKWKWREGEVDKKGEFYGEDWKLYFW